MDNRDRRKHPRFAEKFQLDLLNMGDDPTVSPFEAIVPGTALDVSRHGMKIKSAYNVSVGAFLSVILYNAGSESLCLCEVVWKREEMGELVYGVFTQEWTKIDPKLAAIFDALDAVGDRTGDHASLASASLIPRAA